MDATASHPSGLGGGSGIGAGCRAVRLRGHACPPRRGLPVPGIPFADAVGPVHLRGSRWSCRLVPEEGGCFASSPCRKPVGASASSAVRWGITVQDAGDEMSAVLPAEQTSASSVSSRQAWFLLAFYKQIPFSPLIRTRSLGMVCFKIKFCFGVNCQLLCFCGCLPGCVEELTASPAPGRLSAAPSSFFQGVFIFRQDVGKCKKKLVCFSPGNRSTAPARRTPCCGVH